MKLHTASSLGSFSLPMSLSSTRLYQMFLPHCGLRCIKTIVTCQCGQSPPPPPPPTFPFTSPRSPPLPTMRLITRPPLLCLQVLASYGHIRDLSPRPGSVDVDADFAMTWATAARAAPRVDAIAAALQSASKLVLATDPDREGEAISWHLQQELQVWSVAGSYRGGVDVLFWRQCWSPSQQQSAFCVSISRAA